MSLLDYSVIDETHLANHLRHLSLENTPTTPLDDRFAWNMSDYFTPNTAQLLCHLANPYVPLPSRANLSQMCHFL